LYAGRFSPAARVGVDEIAPIIPCLNASSINVLCFATKPE